MVFIQTYIVVLLQTLHEHGLGKGLIKNAIDRLDHDKDDKIFVADFCRLKEMESDIVERALTGTSRLACARRITC